MVRVITVAFAALIGVACAMPAAEVWPTDSNEALLKYLNSDPSQYNFHPIEGMPTLEDLNLTMADFLKPEYRAAHGLPDPRNSSPAKRFELEKRFDPICYPVQNSGHIQAAYACRDYLNSLGSHPCEVYGALKRTQNCHMDVGNGQVAAVWGMPAYGVSSAVSACADVARGMQWIIDNCLSNNPCHCGVTGENAAWGNGNYLVIIDGAY